MPYKKENSKKEEKTSSGVKPKTGVRKEAFLWGGKRRGGLAKRRGDFANRQKKAGGGGRVKSGVHLLGGKQQNQRLSSEGNKSHSLKRMRKNLRSHQLKGAQPHK